jgi:hypothetical protein
MMCGGATRNAEISDQVHQICAALKDEVSNQAKQQDETGISIS